MKNCWGRPWRRVIDPDPPHRRHGYSSHPDRIRSGRRCVARSPFWSRSKTCLTAIRSRRSSHITDPQSAAGIRQFYEHFAIPVESFARAAGFAIEQPDVDINEILFRSTRQEL